MKKIMSALLLVAILISVLAGCSGSEKGVEDNNAPRPDSMGGSDDTLEEITGPSEFEPLEGVDYGGYKFRIMSPGPEIRGASSTLAAINEIAPEEETGDPINDSVYRRNREVEALYNIEIVPVFLSGERDAVAQSALRSIKANDDAYDAILTVGWNARTLLTDRNNTYNLLEIPNLDLSKSWWAQKAVSELSIANQLHMVTGDISIFSPLTMNIFFMNKEMAENYELENAYDLVRQGKWTWDKLIEMCRQVSRDLDGDGAMTGSDMYGVFGEHASIRFAVQGSGERITKKDENDIPYLAFNTENTVKAIDYILESILNKEIGIYINDYISQYGGDGTRTYNEFGFPKFQNGEILFFYYVLGKALDWRALEWDFGMLPFPKLSEQQSEYYTSTALWNETHLFVPATNQDIDRTGAVLDAMGYYSQKYMRPAVIDVTVINKAVRDDDSAEMVNLMLDTRTYDLGVVYNWGDIDGNVLFTSASSRTNVFASSYEKHESKIISEMEKTINSMLGE